MSSMLPTLGMGSTGGAPLNDPYSNAYNKALSSMSSFGGPRPQPNPTSALSLAGGFGQRGELAGSPNGTGTPPAPTAGRMSSPYGTTGAASPVQAAPAPTPAPAAPASPTGASALPGAAPAAAPTGDLGANQTDPYWKNIWSGFAANSPEAKQLNDYINFLYSMPDYKGRNEANRAAIALYARNLKQNAGSDKMSGADLQGLSDIGANFNSLGDQLSASMAARGMNGGVVAGGMSNLAGKEGAATGDYLASIARQKEQQQLQLQLQQMGFDQQMAMQASQNNRYDQQHKGGFWKDLAGLAGTIGGDLTGGLFGGSNGGNSSGAGAYNEYSNNGYNDYGQRP